MLRKLMKHEFYATGRLMLPLLLLVLVSALGAGGASRVMLNGDNTVTNGIGVLIMMVFVLAILAMCFVAFYLMLQRFYSNLLTDEGYMMMTLPVSVHHHIWSKLLVSVVWFILSALTVAAAILLVMSEAVSVKELVQAINLLWGELCSSGYLGSAIIISVEFVIVVLTGAMAACLRFYAAMAVGQSFAGHKLLWSVLAFFAMGFVLQILQMLGMQIMAPKLFEGEFLSNSDIVVNVKWMLLGGTGLALVQGGIFYGVTAWFLRKRLNLS